MKERDASAGPCCEIKGHSLWISNPNSHLLSSQPVGKSNAIRQGEASFIVVVIIIHIITQAAEHHLASPFNFAPAMCQTCPLVTMCPAVLGAVGGGDYAGGNAISALRKEDDTEEEHALLQKEKKMELHVGMLNDLLMPLTRAVEWA